MKLSNTKAITFFALTIILTGLFSGRANSQIVYVDLDPDVVMTDPGVYTINFFKPHDSIEVQGSGNFDIIRNAQGVFMTTLEDAEVMADGGGAPLAIQKDITIKEKPESGLWKNVTDAILNNSGMSGRWINLKDRYLGLRAMKDGLWYYGWARLDIDAPPTHFTLKDYAFNSVAGDSIMTGQTVLSVVVDEDTEPGFDIIYSNKTLTVKALSDYPAAPGSVEIYSLLGGKVFESALEGSSQTISLESLKPGLYFLRVTLGGSQHLSRLLVY